MCLWSKRTREAPSHHHHFACFPSPSTSSPTNHTGLKSAKGAGAAGCKHARTHTNATGPARQQQPSKGTCGGQGVIGWIVLLPALLEVCFCLVFFLLFTHSHPHNHSTPCIMRQTAGLGRTARAFAALSSALSVISYGVQWLLGPPLNHTNAPASNQNLTRYTLTLCAQALHFTPPRGGDGGGPNGLRGRCSRVR